MDIKVKANSYRTVFDTEKADVKNVMADLCDFCFMLRPTTIADKNNRADPVQSAILEGRREVFLRIMEYKNVDFAQLDKMIQAQKEGKR